MHDFYPMYVTRIENLQNYLTTFRTKTSGRRGSQTRGGQRHLQLDRMLDIDLISEPPPPPPPQMYVSKVWESVWPAGAGSDS